MDYQEDLAVVKDYEKGYARIEIKKTGACKTCGMNSLCGKGSGNSECRVRTDLKLKPGDTVKIHISAGVRIVSSLIIFIFPILMMVAAYILAKYLFEISENFSILVSFAGLLLSGVIIYIVDKILAEKISITIVQKVEK